MSSRNLRLSEEARQEALSIPRALRAAGAAWDEGERRRQRLEAIFRESVLERQSSPEQLDLLMTIVIAFPALLNVGYVLIFLLEDGIERILTRLEPGV